MKIVPRIIATFFLLSSPLVTQAENAFTIGGYFKNFSIALVPSEIKNSLPHFSIDTPLGLVNNRLRLNLSASANPAFAFTFAYDLTPRFQDTALLAQPALMTGTIPFQYRATDLRARLYPARDENFKSFGVFQNLDRAVLTIKTGRADLDIGRQAIAWGSARVINPTDVIAPFTFEELDTEDRVGVDAIRLRMPFGFMGEFDTGIIYGNNYKLKNSAWYLRSKFYLAKTDVSLILVDFQENLLVGIDLARSIGGAGTWCEAAYVVANGFKKFEIDQLANYFRSTLGVDYNFNGKTYGFFEYHFSSAGASQPEDYFSIFANPAIARGGIYLMGRHYLIPGITYQLTSLVNASGQIIINPGDRSFFAAPQIEYNISENIYLSAGVFLSFGSQPELRLGSSLLPVVTFRSEFGSYPDMYFTSFRFYF